MQKIYSNIYPYLISEEGRNCFVSQRHVSYSIETVTLRKHVIKYKYMRKWIAKFLTKSEIGGIKIAWVNSIHIAKYPNLL